MSARIPLRCFLARGVLGSEFQCPRCGGWSPMDLQPDLLGLAQQPQPHRAVYTLACQQSGCLFQEIFDVHTASPRLAAPGR